MNKNSLIVFYSYEGNTRFIAESIKDVIHADLLELRPKKEMTSTGVMKYMWGGKNVILKKKPELHEFDMNPEDYDIILIGTPVWVLTYAPPLRTFFSKVQLQNKNIALFCCHEGGRGKTLENMEKELPGNNIIGKIDFNHPLYTMKNEQKNKAISWAEQIQDQSQL